MYVYKEKGCATCGRTYRPTGGKNFWCSLLCRVLDCCDVASDVDACWPWNRSFDRRGYGEIRLAPVTRFAHRVMFEEFTRTRLTPHEVVRHTCDNPPCCNPYHLEAGSQADNVMDMLVRGRGQDYSHQPRGEAHPLAKITEETALAIFHATGKLDDIAARFHTTRNTVERIRYGGCWNHVTGLPKRRRLKQAG